MEAEARQPQITERLSELEHAVFTVGENTDKLEERLSSILRTDPEESKLANQKNPEQPIAWVPLANELTKYIEILEAIAAKVRSILTRLEI